MAAIVAGASAPLSGSVNRFFNPDFDTGVVGWDYPSSTPDWYDEDRDECAGSGSAVASSQPILADTVHFADFVQAIPAGGGETLFLRADARPILITTASLDARILVIFCGPAGCGEPDFGPLVVVPAGTWTRVTRPPVAVPTGVDQAVVSFLFETSSPFDVLLDRTYGSEGDGLFGDDFEVGESCRWSLSTP